MESYPYIDENGKVSQMTEAQYSDFLIEVDESNKVLTLLKAKDVLANIEEAYERGVKDAE